jgi:hypothetical protein
VAGSDVAVEQDSAEVLHWLDFVNSSWVGWVRERVWTLEMSDDECVQKVESVGLSIGIAEYSRMIIAETREVFDGQLQEISADHCAKLIRNRLSLTPG